MTKSKWTLLLSLAAITILVLTACSGGTAPESNPPDNGNAPTNNDAPNTAPEEPANENDSTNNNNSTDEVSQPAEEQDTEEPAAEPVDPPAEEMAAGLSFTGDVNPILQSRCANCHGIDRIEGELVMLTYDDLMKGGESGPVIIAGDADNSYLAELISTQKMPKRGPKLTPVQTQTIIDWINQGALNN